MKVFAIIAIVCLPGAILAKEAQGQGTFSKWELSETGGFFEAREQTLYTDLPIRKIEVYFRELVPGWMILSCGPARQKGSRVARETFTSTDEYSDDERDIWRNAERFKALIVDTVIKNADLNVSG